MNRPQEFWDQIWRGDDWGIASNLGYGLQENLDPDLLVGKHVLDVGCGNSLYSLIPDDAERFIGVDISGVALRKAHRMSPKSYLLQASGLALPLGDKVVDYSVCFEALSLFGEHSDIALAEMARVSRDGMLFTVSHPDHKLASATLKYRELSLGKLFLGAGTTVTAFTEEEISSLVTSLGMYMETLVVLSFNEVMNYGVPFMQQGVYTHGTEKEAMYVKAVHPKV